MTATLRRASTVERGLAVAGGLLLVDTFLPWYDGPGGVSANAWQAFTLLQLALLALALLAVAPLAVVALEAAVPRLQLSLTVLGTASGAALLVAFRLLNPPGVDDQGTSVAAGAWLGLLLCLAVAVGAYLVSREVEPA